MISSAQPILWEQRRTIPRWASAVLAALRFEGASGEALQSLDETDWQKLLSFCDRTQLTLPFGQIARDSLPGWVRSRIDRNLSDNSERLECHKRALLEISDRLEAAGIEYLLLKGFSLGSEYAADPRLRVQYDLDLFCPQESLLPARDALLGLGYEPFREFEEFPIDHLPAMVRKTRWQWHGDYFDPEMPISVDLHFRFWDEATERVSVPGLEEFWPRRTGQQIDGRTVPVLHSADLVGYAALHALRHLLRGSLRLSNICELAYFLHKHAGDDEFWSVWRDLHPAGLRWLEAICFRLAAAWFGCRLALAVEEEIRRLPGDIQFWFERYAASPVEAMFTPNKDELWLHFCLLDSFRDKRKVLLRRLFPTRIPALFEAVPITGEQVGWGLRWQKWAKYFAYVAARGIHHLLAFAPTVWHGVLWWWRGRNLGKTFWVFLLAASVFSFGLFIFFLLYNLYLLDLGFTEDFLGLLTSAMTAGSIAGALPAARLAQRFGLERTLLAALAGTAGMLTLRSVAVGETALAASAFLGGVFWAVWAVSVAPVIARLTTEQRRPLGFSLFFATGIGMGILGGVAGGRLPQWLVQIGAAAGGAQAKQASLLIGCGICALAAWPVSRLRLPPPPPIERTSYPRSPFVTRFLLALAVWTLATGSFNPFFNAYFSRHLATAVDRIGLIFSGGQLAQVVAILAAPVVLRKLGLVGGIVGMQLATGIGLAALAAGPPGLAAAFVYAGYMAFQWMSEPGMYTLLMNRVPPAQRSGASALNFLVIFSCQAIAAYLAGSAITRFGYPAVLGASACLASVAALLFRRLRRLSADLPEPRSP